MKLAFLGGTVANNDWRSFLIQDLAARGIASDCLFDPVVKDWNEEAQAREEAAKRDASHLVFYIADPKQDGNPLSAYSMVEATMALYDKPERTTVVFDSAGMLGHPAKAMAQALRVLKARFPDANILGSYEEAVAWLARELA
jgi:hypothetical protein